MHPIVFILLATAVISTVTLGTCFGAMAMRSITPRFAYAAALGGAVVSAVLVGLWCFSDFWFGRRPEHQWLIYLSTIPMAVSFGMCIYISGRVGSDD